MTHEPQTLSYRTPPPVRSSGVRAALEWVFVIGVAVLLMIGPMKCIGLALIAFAGHCSAHLAESRRKQWCAHTVTFVALASIFVVLSVASAKGPVDLPPPDERAAVALRVEETERRIAELEAEQARLRWGRRGTTGGQGTD